MPEPTDSQFVRHEPCPNCTSSDAFAVYSDGGGYCFSCGHHVRGSGADAGESTPASPERIAYDGDFARLPKRRISEDTCKKFNVRVAEGVVRFPYYSSAGQVVGYKERNASKDFRWHGKNSDKRLFGQNLFGGGKSLVITEGEMDALSVWQARPNWPVMSLPSGAQGAKKALAAQLTELMKFDEIILMFDADEPGVKAAEECVSLFPPDKVFLASLGSYKDASEALQANDAEAIRQAVWNKRTHSPASIIDGRTLFDLVSTPLHGKDADWPYHSLNDVTSGLRLGELVTVTAGSGVGKSTFCGETAVSLIDQGFNVGYIALEESIKRTGLRLMTVKANKPLHLSNEIPTDQLRAAFDATVGSGHVYLRDGFGSIDPEVILSDIRFMVKAHDVKFVILDHLSILLSGNESADERKTLDVVMTKLRSFVEETGIGMILISHLRRAHQDKGHEDGAQISLSQLRGSHSIAQLSDLVLAIQRSVSDGSDQAELKVLKNRFNGQTGPAGYLAYDKDTGRLQASEKIATTDTPVSYDDF